MKANNDYMVINPLVILLAAVFIAGTVMFLPTVYPGISEITYILSTANILPKLNLMLNILYPCLMAVSAILILVNSVLTLIRKQAMLLGISIIVFAAASVVFGLYGVLAYALDRSNILELLLTGIANLVTALMAVPVIIFTFTKRRGLVSKILSLVSALILFAVLSFCFTDIRSVFGPYANSDNIFIQFYPMFVTLVPFCIVLSIAFPAPEKHEEAAVQEHEQPVTDTTEPAP